MKTRETLKNIIDKKNFKTFWHCYEFLTTASYSPMEAFSASVEHFGLDKLFDNVAFFRTCDDMWVAHSVYSSPQSAPPRLIIGVINENNQYLTEFYKIYHKQYSEGEVGIQRDIEETCEVIKIYDITPFITDFVMEKMYKRFNIDSGKKFAKIIKDIQQQAIPRNLEDNMNALRDTIGKKNDIYLDSLFRRFDDYGIPRPTQPYNPPTPRQPYNPPTPRQDNIRFLKPDNDADNNRA